MTEERLPRIVAANAAPPRRLGLTWSDGRTADLDLAMLGAPGFEALADAVFLAARLDPWGHHIAWPGGLELGADRLWLESLTQWGCDDTRGFIEWRLRHGLSLSRAAEALGIRPSQVAAYSTAAKPVPRQVTLACRGWESLLTAA